MEQKDISVDEIPVRGIVKKRKRYTLIKVKKLTLRYYRKINHLTTYYYLKLPFQKPTLKLFFYKNIASNDDYINKHCIPNQTEFTDKCNM